MSMKYVAAGARTDCLNIVERFAKLNTMRMKAYTDIWQELKFSYIYFGHNCLDELIEFTEEVLRIAKEIWLKSELLNEQAGGLYTVYGLYLKQPTTGLVKVRLTPKDHEMVQKFHERVKVEGHHDANYVVARMYMIGAFHFCISEYTFGLEKSFRRYHEKDRSLSEIKDEPVFLKRLKNNDIFNQLEEAFKEYHISKCKLVGEGSQEPPPLLRYVDPQFGQKLKEQFRTITQKYDDDDDSSNIQRTETQVESGSSKSIPLVEPRSSKPVPQVEPRSSKPVPQVKPRSSKPVPQVEPRSSKPVPQVELRSSKPVPQVKPRSSKPVPQVEPASSESVPQVEPASSESVPQVEPGSSESVPQVEPGSSESVPQVESGTSESVPQVEPASSDSVPQVEPGSSESVPQVKPASSESVPQVEPGSSKSIPPSKNSPPTDDPIKLPWWLMPGRNRYLKISASDSDNDSDGEDDGDGVNDVKTPNNKGTSQRTTKDKREALNLALGMSEDEEETVTGNERSHHSGNICEVGSSLDMPDLS